MILVTGGAACGKSAIAERLACACGGEKAYLATLEVRDDESRARVARHRAMRAGGGFFTFECPTALPQEADLSGFHTGLLECVTTLTANVMFSQHRSETQTVAFVSVELARLRASLPCLVAVTGDVFSDGGAYDAFTTKYLRALGEINRTAANMADLVVESVCSIPVVHKGKEVWEDFEDLF